VTDIANALKMAYFFLNVKPIEDESSTAFLTKINLYFTLNKNLIIKNKVNVAQETTQICYKITGNIKALLRKKAVFLSVTAAGIHVYNRTFKYLAVIYNSIRSTI
jgi:hypothetical protein